LGHYLLSQLLLPCLNKSSEHGRIVNIVSRQCEKGTRTIHFNNLKDLGVGSHTTFELYAHSQLALLLGGTMGLNEQQAQENSHATTRIVAASVGNVNSTLNRHDSPLKRLFKHVLGYVFKRSDEEGARSVLWAALCDDKKVADPCPFYEDGKRMYIYFNNPW